MVFYKKQIVCLFAAALCCISSFSYSQWIKKGGTGGLSLGESVALDNAGNVYSTGTFFCNLIFDGDTLLNNTCTDLTGIPRYDGFIVKYDENGTLQWAVQITGEKAKTLSIKGIATDNSGHCYITGSYTGSLTFGGTTITNNTALQDIFIARYLSNGTFDWVRTGFARMANSFIQSNTVAADATGNSFIAGIYKDSIIFEEDTLPPSPAQEFFFAKFDASGTYQWVQHSTGDGTGSAASINDLTIDASQHLYVAGTFQDTVVIFPGDTLRSTSGQSGIFIARYLDPPALQWVRQENVNNAAANGISLDKTYKKVLIAGQYRGTATIGTEVLTPSGSDHAAFVASYDTTGVFLWARDVRVSTGDSAATGRSVGVDPFGSVYLTGNFGRNNSSSSVTTGPLTQPGSHGYDGFVAKYDSNGTVKWLQTLGGSLNDDVRDIDVRDSSNVYIAGYFSLYARVDSMVVTNDSTGGFNSYTAELDICPYYSADITAGGPTTFCQKDSVLLTATAGIGFTYQWQKDDVNIPGATTQTLYASDSAAYRVIITNPAIPCTKYSIPLVITVNSLPDVTISKNDTTVFCTGNNVRLSAPLGNKYQWLESGNVLPPDTNFSLTVTTTGYYQVIAENSKGCKDTSSITEVMVIPYPVASITPSGKFIICQGDSVTLNSNTAPLYKYQWLKNNIVLPNDTLPVYQAKTSGIFKIRISNELGCSTTSSSADTITVISTPPATITISGNNTFCTYQSTTLIANSGIGLRYRWERNGLPLLPADTLSSYLPIASGNYSVQVSNSTGCEATSSTAAITIHPQPSATLTAGSPISICAGDSVQLNASTGAGYSYIWQRNGSVITGAASPVFYAKNTGNYRVLLTDPTGCSDTSGLLTVTINPLPAATLSALGSTSFCAGDSVELKASSGTGFIYSWKLDGTPIPGPYGTSYQAKVPGNYTVQITNTSNCTLESASIPVTVFTTPPAIITPSGTTTFCQGDSVTLEANTAPGFSYVWRKDGFTFPANTSSSLKVKNSGNYSVQVSITSTCTNTSAPIMITVKPNLKPEITINGTNISTSFFTSYQWNRNGTPIAGANNQIYEAIVNGIYTVTVENSHHCTSTADPVTVCVPAPYITTAGALLKASPGASWQWYLEDILINGATSQNYLAQTSGIYKVKVRDQSNCESYSLPVPICVPAPVITLGANNVLYSSSGVAWQWYLDEMEIPGANTQIHIAESTGSYTVRVEDFHSCESVSMPLSLSVTGLRQEMNTSGILLYPNPANNFLSISFKNQFRGIITIELLDLPGNSVLSNQISKEGYEAESGLALNGLPAGSYLVRITDETGNSSMHKLNKIHE